LGIARPQPRLQATTGEAVVLDDRRSRLARENVIDVSRPVTGARTFLEGVVSLAAAAGLALLVPFVMLLIGTPIALGARCAIEAASWLMALIFG
jgi:hypothetical protein